MRSIKILAPAKVNLFLKILNRRSDSYHNILTLFERITLTDEITISKTPEGIEVSSNRFITADPKDNLAYKAAEAILKYKRVDRGVRIRVKKGIPIAAGLGGGSSDAAGVLLGMNRLFKFGLKQNELLRLGSRLGADVPFFVSNMRFAIGKGRGEVLIRSGLKMNLWHLIVYPGFTLSTKDVYNAFDRNIAIKTKDLTLRQCSGSSPEQLPKGLTKKSGDVKIQPGIKASMDFDKLEEMLYNDLQDIAVAKKKVIGRIIERLASSLGKKIVVSGSGPSVFCLYRTRREAIKAKDRLLACVSALERKRWQIFVAGTKI